MVKGQEDRALNWKTVLFGSHQRLAKVTFMISLKLPRDKHIPPKLFHNSSWLLFYLKHFYFVSDKIHAYPDFLCQASFWKVLMIQGREEYLGESKYYQFQGCSVQPRKVPSTFSFCQLIKNQFLRFNLARRLSQETQVLV